MPAPPNFRKEIGTCLRPYFRADRRWFLLVCDMGFGVTDRLQKEFPRRVINCGIMEPGTVGIAAGMSQSGCLPIVYSIVNFLVYRSLEQMRNDVVLSRVNVKFIATGANDYFKFLGPSHCCRRDDLALMRLIGLKVYDPYSSRRPFAALVHAWLNDDAAGYLRV